ncbi:MAG: hypothetical protein WCN98_14395, partial [Verrucomicrobiaceae bacterium]
MQLSQIIGAFNSAGFPKQTLKGWNQDCCKNPNDSNSYQDLQQRYTGSLSYGQKNTPKAKYFHRNSYSGVKIRSKPLPETTGTLLGILLNSSILQL